MTALFLKHGTLYKYYLKWPGGEGERISPYAVRVIQDEKQSISLLRRYGIRKKKKYKWKYPSVKEGRYKTAENQKTVKKTSEGEKKSGNRLSSYNL